MQPKYELLYLAYCGEFYNGGVVGEIDTQTELKSIYNPHKTPHFHFLFSTPSQMPTLRTRDPYKLRLTLQLTHTTPLEPHQQRGVFAS